MLLNVCLPVRLSVAGTDLATHSDITRCSSYGNGAILSQCNMQHVTILLLLDMRLIVPTHCTLSRSVHHASLLLPSVVTVLILGSSNFTFCTLSTPAPFFIIISDDPKRSLTRVSKSRKLFKGGSHSGYFNDIERPLTRISRFILYQKCQKRCKKEPPLTCSDYRPICIIPIFARLMEKLVVRDFLYPILVHLDHCHLFHDQFAFRPAGSTTAAVIYLLQVLTELLQSTMSMSSPLIS